MWTISLQVYVFNIEHGNEHGSCSPQSHTTKRVSQKQVKECGKIQKNPQSEVFLDVDNIPSSLPCSMNTVMNTVAVPTKRVSQKQS
eukprot:g7428.t1